MKFRSSLIGLLVGVLLLTACQPAATPTNAPVPTQAPATAVPATEVPEDVELVIWNTWADFHVTAFQAILDDFNASHPNITVIQQAQPYTDYEAKQMQAVSQGVGPDLVVSFPTVAASFIGADLLTNLSPYIDDPEIGIPGFKESLGAGVYAEVTQWGGDVYMIPMLVGGEVYYYNKTIFDQVGVAVPTTWAELETAARAITAVTGKPAFGFDSEIDGFQVLIEQNGSGYINPDTLTVEYNNPVAVQQLEWFCGLVQEGVFRLVGEDVYFSNPFGSQAVASYIGSAAGYGFVEGAVNGQFEFDVAAIPQGGQKEYISSWGSSWMVFKSTEAKQRAAFEFIKYMNTPEVLAGWAAAFGGVPAYQPAIAQPAFQDYMATNAAIRAQTAQIDRVGYLSAINGSAAIRTIIGRAVTSACTGQATAAEALQLAEDEGNAELANSN